MSHQGSTRNDATAVSSTTTTVSAQVSESGPPTLAEIRLHLRDNAPEDNTLLDNIDFDTSEIVLAIQRPIEQWNETPPEIQKYNTSNFPYRYHWLEAICGNLFLMAAENYRRNHFPYAAAGVSIDDKNKFQAYQDAAERRLAQWKAWMLRKKVEINAAAAYGSIGSMYDALGY